MLKGIGEPEMWVGVIIFAMFVAYAALAVFSSITYTTALGAESEKVQAVDFAHLAVSCFMHEGVINESRLTDAVYRACNLPEGRIVIHDIQQGGEWTFGDADATAKKHSLNVAIARQNGDVHGGELSVRF
jgi:hypothetical protein